ncbi:MAG TPA: ribosome maturation factor RimM [Mycobacteriales bacterium]|nr:ribosome maturation factor RimM [Mycobacteriales bacterium]
MQLVVGRIAKAHGVHGDLAVEVRTDDASRRFAPGAVLETDPPGSGPLRIETARWHSGRLLVRFAGVADRAAAEGLRGTLLVADSATCAVLEEPDEYWDHELAGVTAVTVPGAPLGVVEEVLHTAGAAVLVVRRPDGGELLVPFVAAIVPVVDLAARRLVVVPPAGLLEL